MSFLVVGSQRSGTLSIAKMFNIYHEVQFNPRMRHQYIHNITKIDSEVSWLAVPFLPELCRRINIIHLVREPIAVIRSLVGIGIFDLKNAEEKNHRPYRDFIERHIKLRGGNLEKCVDYYLKWDQMIENSGPFPMIRIEDIYGAPVLNCRMRGEVEYSDCSPKLKECAVKYGYDTH